MRFSPGNYSKGLLILLSMLGSETTLANKPANDAARPAIITHAGFFSALPASLKLKHGHALIQIGGFLASQEKAQHVNIEHDAFMTNTAKMQHWPCVPNKNEIQEVI